MLGDFAIAHPGGEMGEQFQFADRNVPKGAPGKCNHNLLLT